MQRTRQFFNYQSKQTATKVNFTVIIWLLLTMILQPTCTQLTGGDTSDSTVGAPINVTVVLTHWYPSAIRVSWFYKDAGDGASPENSVKLFQIKYNPVNSRFRKIQEVPQYVRNITLEHLIPNRQYRLEVTTVAESGATNSSPVILFISPANESSSRRVGRYRALRTDYGEQYYGERKGVSIRADEAVIIFFVLCVWVAVIGLFLRSWGKIRHLEPYQPQYVQAVEPTPFPSPVYSIHPKPSRMNTCTSASVSGGQFVTNSSGVNISLERRRTFSQGSKLYQMGSSFGGRPLYHCASACVYHQSPSRSRTRLDSLFAGCEQHYHHHHRNSLLPEPLKRRIKSAEDLKSLFNVQTTSATTATTMDNSTSSRSDRTTTADYEAIISIDRSTD